MFSGIFKDFLRFPAIFEIPAPLSTRVELKGSKLINHKESRTNWKFLSRFKTGLATQQPTQNREKGSKTISHKKQQ